MSHTQRASIALLAITLLIAVVIYRFAGQGAPFVWLISVNFTALVVYGYDKKIAASGRRRIPERVLLGLALFGGALGAFVGMQVFRHKTAKPSFQLKFWSIIAVQAAAALAYLLWLQS